MTDFPPAPPQDDAVPEHDPRPPVLPEDGAPPAAAETLAAAEMGEPVAPSALPAAGPGCPDLAAEIDRINETLQSYTARFVSYEDLVRQLQGRIEVLQRDQVQELLGPVLQRLAALLTEAMAAARRAREEGPAFRAETEFEYFADAITESLDLLGVQSVGAGAGDPFDSSVHSTRRVVATDDPALDWTVAKVLRQGLRRGDADRAFLPAQVTVHRCTVPAPAPTTPGLEPIPHPDTEGELR